MNGTSAFTTSSSRPAIFLDRDGTMNEDVGYLSELSHLTLYPWTIDAVRLFNRAGYAVVVVTNQGGIGRKMIRPEFVGELHAEIAARLARGGAHVDGWYHCPHHPAALIDELRVDCRCRKPEPGMVLDAVRDLGLDPTRSWVIGDKWLDVQLGQRVGARGILVRTGWGRLEEETRPEGQAVYAICDTLAEAAAVVLAAGVGGSAKVVLSGRMAKASEDSVSARLAALLRAARGRRVVVLGDLIADEYVSGRIARVSREAPVLILEYDSTDIRPGGAGNAAHNVAALGGAATLVALAGRDEPGRRVLGGVPTRRRHASSSCGPPGIAPRSRRGSSPAASIRPSNRWSASTGTPASRSPTAGAPRGCEPPPGPCAAPTPCSSPTTARACCRRRIVEALVRPLRLRRRPRAGARRFALRPAALPRTDRLHAERVGGRAGAGHDDWRQRAGARTRRPRHPRPHPHGRGAGHPRQPRHGALRAGRADACTCRSTGPTRSPTSPARATR